MEEAIEKSESIVSHMMEDLIQAKQWQKEVGHKFAGLEEECRSVHEVEKQGRCEWEQRMIESYKALEYKLVEGVDQTRNEILQMVGQWKLK